MPSCLRQKVKDKYLIPDSFFFFLTLFLLRSFNPNSNVCLISDMCSIISLPLFFPPSDWTKQTSMLIWKLVPPAHPSPAPFALLAPPAQQYVTQSDCLLRVRRWQPPCVTLVMVARWWRRLLSRVDVWHWHSRERGAGCQASGRKPPNSCHYIQHTGCRVLKSLNFRP